MMHIITLTLSLALAACALEEPPEHLAVEAEPDGDPTEGIPCDVLKGPPVLPETVPTPPWRYAEEFDLVIGYADGSPFLQLAPEEYQAFRASLRFNEAGLLTSYRYDVLQAALSPDDFAAAEAALGRRKDNLGDYYCSGRATCSRQSGSVCVTHNC